MEKWLTKVADKVLKRFGVSGSTGGLLSRGVIGAPTWMHNPLPAKYLTSDFLIFTTNVTFGPGIQVTLLFYPKHNVHNFFHIGFIGALNIYEIAAIGIIAGMNIGTLSAQGSIAIAKTIDVDPIHPTISNGVE